MLDLSWCDWKNLGAKHRDNGCNVHRAVFLSGHEWAVHQAVVRELTEHVGEPPGKVDAGLVHSEHDLPDLVVTLALVLDIIKLVRLFTIDRRHVLRPTVDLFCRQSLVRPIRIGRPLIHLVVLTRPPLGWLDRRPIWQVLHVSDSCAEKKKMGNVPGRSSPFVASVSVVTSVDTGCVGFAEPVVQWVDQDLFNLMWLRLVSASWRDALEGTLARVVALDGQNSCLEKALKGPFPLEGIKWLVKGSDLQADALQELLPQAVSARKLEVASWLVDRFGFGIENCCRCGQTVSSTRQCHLHDLNLTSEFADWIQRTFDLRIETQDRVVRLIQRARGSQYRAWLATHLQNVGPELCRKCNQLRDLDFFKQVYEFTGQQMRHYMPVHSILMELCRSGDLKSLQLLTKVAELVLNEIHTNNCLGVAIQHGHMPVATWMRRQFGMGASYMMRMTQR